MKLTLHGALLAPFVLTALAAPALAQTGTKPLPEPLPMGVPYVYQPGNPYWYAPAVPVYSSSWYVPVPAPGTTRYAPVVPYYSYPFASATPVFGRYSWDYTGIPARGYGWYSTAVPHYPYSYQYPTLTGRVWMGYGW
ncbi:hypothetical protein [Frigoriglobus tundricola]|uniref:Uncharacterized protein n=1 Tax=Frigoriglobus tundricola TaxID=2774151 RepID=A0A6M5YSQ2_9BACT|nr:hypothetical protein [Frigoriglobus tundricola]QJW96889.1 hypothetical protein FTUN_4449 [Frigoriglobus tundricola]